MSISSQKISSQNWPDLKYGLGLAFDPATVAWPTGLATAEQALAVRAPQGVTVRAGGTSAVAPSDRLAVSHRSAAKVWRVDVPANFRAVEPVVVDTRFNPGFTAEEIEISVGAGSQVSFVEHGLPVSGSEPAFRSARLRLTAGSGAKVNYVRLQDAQRSAVEWHESTVLIGAGAEVTWLDAVFGGNFAHAGVVASLVGEGAAFRHRALTFGDAGQRFDLMATASHEAARTVSDMAVRGAVAAGAKAIVRGRVTVKNGTMGCVGRQELRGFILAPGAEFDAQPQLETGTEDVRASHAAAVGRLDREKLFYLMARGLDRATAVRLLTEAFFAPLLAVMRGSGLEEAAACIITERLKALTDRL